MIDLTQKSTFALEAPFQGSLPEIWEGVPPLERRSFSFLSYLGDIKQLKEENLQWKEIARILGKKSGCEVSPSKLQANYCRYLRKERESEQIFQKVINSGMMIDILEEVSDRAQPSSSSLKEETDETFDGSPGKWAEHLYPERVFEEFK